MIGKKIYTKEDIEKIFQHGISRGMMLYGMVMHGRMKNEDIKILDKYWPDLKGYINSDKFKDNQE